MYKYYNIPVLLSNAAFKYSIIYTTTNFLAHYKYVCGAPTFVAHGAGAPQRNNFQISQKFEKISVAH